LIGDEVVHVLRTIITSRSEYFRALLDSKQVTDTVKSKIDIHGIDVDSFKMIIEWIYTMDIRSLNDPGSPTLLLDLQNVYVAADMYLLPDLCNSIRNYLSDLVTARNFGEIYQVAKRIGCESLEKDVIRSWISNSASFNENDDQIAMFREQGVEIGEGMNEASKEARGEKLNGFGEICRKMIEASEWEGKSDSKSSVVKGLASLLTPKTE
jgi:hypothetical protein